MNAAVTKKNSFRTIVACAMTTVAFAGISARADAIILYADDFSGDSSTELNGLAPDVRSGTHGSSGTATWNARTLFGDSFLANGRSSRGNRGSALLPFTPESGYLYELSVDVDPIDDSFFPEQLVSAGFSQNADTTRDFSTNNGYAWMAVSNLVGTDEGFRYAGAGSANVGTFDTAGTGAMNFKILLDTRDTDWSVEWYLNDVKVTDTYTYSTNPTINYVGLSVEQNGRAMFDNLQLSVIPEPGSLALVALTLPLFFFLRRFRR